MKRILLNMALFQLTEFCLQNNIDCSGTYCQKHGRGFTYDLIRETDGAIVAQITFYKSQVPDFRSKHLQRDHTGVLGETIT